MRIFVDSGATTDWLDYLGTLSPPEHAVRLPTGDDLAHALRYVEVPEEDIPDVMALATLVMDDDRLWWTLERAVWSLAKHMATVDGPPRFAALRDPNDPVYRYFYVLVFVAAMPQVQAYLRVHHVPEEVVQATLADLGRNVRVHRKREGVGGLGVMWWLMLHFRGMIFQLGRLQFERAAMGDGIADSVRAAGGDVDAKTLVLSLHIPDFSGPMTPEACDVAIDRARAFFPSHFPGEPYRYAVCHSWLLDPRLKEYLRPDSNIVRFQERFHLAGKGWDSTDGIMQFVFGKTAKEIDAVAPRTSLERAVVDHIRSGGTWWGYGGWFALDGEDVHPGE